MAPPRPVNRAPGLSYSRGTNTRRALEPALAAEVDLVVHGGDLLFRSKVRPGLVVQALEPLLAAHEHLHVLDPLRTVRLDLAGTRVAVGGFPCERDEIRDRFLTLVSGCSSSRASRAS